MTGSVTSHAAFSAATQLRGHLRTIEMCRLVEVPRQPAGDGLDVDRDQRLAALVSAYHAHRTVLLGWRRLPGSGVIDVVIGGRSLWGAAGQRLTLTLPAGGIGVRLPDEVGALMEKVRFWTRIAGFADGLLVDDVGRNAPSAVRPSLEDCLLGAWRESFAWLVIAEPVSTADTSEQIDCIADAERCARARAARSPEHMLDADRYTRRHRELTRALATGLWRIHLLVGGCDAEAATRIAGLICASADLAELPYALTPTGQPDAFDVVVDTSADTPGGATSPLLASSTLLAAVARPPVREIPGVRFALRPDFDVTPERADLPGAEIRLGHVIDRNNEPVDDLHLPHASLNRHTFVCGATGAGKSQTTRGLLEAAGRSGLPWLVIEPAKAEYRSMAARLAGIAEVIAIRPGQIDTLPAGINPLEPATDANGRRFPLQTHADLVRALFLAAFEADDPFPQVLTAGLTRCYDELGWDLALGEPATPGVVPRFPTLGDLQHAAEQVVDDIGYSTKVTDDVRGFIRVRLSSLRLGTTGRFFEGGHQIDFGKLLAHNVVFEIEDVGDDRDKAFLMGTVLIRLVEHLRLEHRRLGGGPTHLRHLSVFEEAHRLLRRTDGTGPVAHAVEMFAGLLAEIRAYGEGLIIAEQIPSKLVADVIKNTAIKIVHRLPALDDRLAVGATMNITDKQSEYLVTLNPGVAAVFTDGMDYPVLVGMDDGSTRETSGTAEATSAAGLVTPRSATCGPDCLTQPCTLRQMRAAQRSPQTQPMLVTWAELAVLAHLTGWTMPRPRAKHLDELRAMDDRLRDCSLSHAVDAAVASRSGVIADRVSPAALAAHVITAMRKLVANGEPHHGEEPQWLAKPYRWCLVMNALHAVHRRNPVAGRHPRSDEWKGQYGRTVPGDTNHAQLATVSRWVDADLRDVDGKRTTAFGADRTPAIVTTVGVPRDHPDWPAVLQENLRAFVSCEWPLRYLTRAPRR